MDLFSFIPNELLYIILNYADYKTILALNELLGERIDILSYIRKEAHIHSGLITDQYNLEQVTRICRLPARSNIVAGDLESFIIRECGVYYFGSGLFGDTQYQHIVPELNANKNTIQLVSGTCQSLILTDNGLVYSYELAGDMSLSNELIPDLVNVIQIATCEYHSYILTVDGNVYAHGENYDGELGLSDYEDRDIYTHIQSLQNIISISTGYKHTLFLDFDNRVYGCGCNKYGQLIPSYEEFDFTSSKSINNFIDIKTPILIAKNVIQIAAGYDVSALLTMEGDVLIFGTEFESRQLIMSNIKTISLGSSLLAITNDHRLCYCNNGEIKYYDLDAVSISTGYDHSLIETVDRKVYGLGSNEYGQLGLYDIEFTDVPILIYI